MEATHISKHMFHNGNRWAKVKFLKGRIKSQKNCRGLTPKGREGLLVLNDCRFVDVPFVRLYPSLGAVYKVVKLCGYFR